jgi:hypothetical protein
MSPATSIISGFAITSIFCSMLNVLGGSKVIVRIAVWILMCATSEATTLVCKPLRKTLSVSVVVAIVTPTAGSGQGHAFQAAIKQSAA